jgi:hypothetical protein
MLINYEPKFILPSSFLCFANFHHLAKIANVTNIKDFVEQKKCKSCLI